MITSLTYTTVVFIGYPAGAALSVLIVERFDRCWTIVGSALLMAIFGLALGMATGGLIQITKDTLSPAISVRLATEIAFGVAKMVPLNAPIGEM